ncbi:MAG TPA: thiamine pyrophosphate-binding protein [Anaerolineales bacterium]|nr:thiamine pyrophosphate-binding protein [Anaerolineales bacterium]
MIKLSDYVIDFLVKNSISDIFMVSGGGIMHLVDSVGRHPGMKYTCNYHEQACVIAAEAYARVKNHVGACLVTTGPGSTNALSGAAGAWVDSIPLIIISGQVRRDLIADYKKLRQLGPQEINIIDMVRPITKHAVTVTDPQHIRYELEYGLHQATAGKPGPVWINIPLDVQGVVIEEEQLQKFDQVQINHNKELPGKINDVKKIIGLLQQAKRPVLICGNGNHIAKADELLEMLIDKLQIPVLLTVGGMDLLDENHEFNMGRFGPIGQRRSNFVLQNADLIISIGASMSMVSTGFNISGFAPRAYKVMVNIDDGELSKSTYVPDLAIQCDAKDLIEVFLDQIDDVEFPARNKWKAACQNWKTRYPTCVPEYYAEPEYVNTYAFIDALSDLLAPHDIVTTGNSLDIASVYQTLRVQKGQRMITNINYGAMGWDLPGTIGACIGRHNQRTILITGDGSIQFNIHELLTISYYHLNIKIFIVNNQGYDSIRATQNNYFEGRFVGADASSGIGSPNYRLLADAYGLRYEHILNNADVREKLPAILAYDGPVLCELNVAYNQGRSPKISSYRREDGTMESRPLEDMYPFLPREEILENMQLFDNEEA